MSLRADEKWMSISELAEGKIDKLLRRGQVLNLIRNMSIR